MDEKRLVRIVEKGSRVSGNGGFPELTEKDIGRIVILTRPCMTWNGFLGYFKDDKKKKKYAFWYEEVEDNVKKE